MDLEVGILVHVVYWEMILGSTVREWIEKSPPLLSTISEQISTVGTGSQFHGSLSSYRSLLGHFLI
jgi:hypothetical protein